MKMGQFSKTVSRIVYQRDAELITSPARNSMDNFVKQVIFTTAFSLFTSGVFLSGYLIYLGASDELVSYVMLIPSICGIFMIFCAGFAEKHERKRKFVLIINALTKIILISIIFVPLFTPKKFQIPIIYFLLVVGYILNGINALGINSWFISVIPVKIRGRYFSLRQIISVVLSIILPVLAGKLIDLIPDKYNGFLILYIFALAAAIFENYYFSKIDDPVVKSFSKNIRVIDIIKIPLHNKDFMVYTIILALFFFFLYISASFTQIYMIKYLKLSYTYINSVSIISSVLQALVFYKVWGKINDEFGPNFVMITSMWFYALDVLLWVFNTPETIKYILPFSFAIAAIEGSGFVVGSFNRRYEIIPEEGRSIYDSFFSAVIGLVLIISPMAGSWLRNVTAEIGFINQLQYGSFRIVYLFSAITLIILQVFNIYYIKKTMPDSRCLKRSSYTGAIRTLKHHFRFLGR